jgi:amino acid adenylation domain-containing protein
MFKKESKSIPNEDLKSLRYTESSSLNRQYPASEIFPVLSFEQERMFFADILTPGNPAFHIPGAFMIKGFLDIEILGESISEIIRRHEILRTCFEFVNGAPAQIITPPFKAKLPLCDLSDISASDKETKIRSEMLRIVQKPFNIAQEPPWQACAIRISQEEHILVLIMHHIICDGDLTLEIFFQEITALYEAFSSGRQSPLPEIPIQYKDFTRLQQKHFQSNAMDSQLEYWLKQIGGNPPAIQLPIDRPYPAIQTYTGDCIHMRISKNVIQKLCLLAEMEGVDNFVILLAVFKTLLHRYSGQADIITGIPSSGRGVSGTEKMIGYFGNPLVLRSNFSNNPEFRKFLSCVNQTLIDAESNQDYPFQKLVEVLEPERDMGRQPLFQVLFLQRNSFTEEWKLNNFNITRIDAETGAVPYDLLVSFRESSQEMIWTWEYNRDLFDRTTIERMARHFKNLLEAVLSDPDQRVGLISFLDDSERMLILETWNNSPSNVQNDGKFPSDDVLRQVPGIAFVPGQQDKSVNTEEKAVHHKSDTLPYSCVHNMFETQAEKTPDAPALEYEGEVISYKSLNRRSNQLGNYLLSLGLKKGNPVGLCMERSVEMIASILGIIKAGGICVPLDPTYPKDRLAYMLSDSQADMLITNSMHIHILPEASRIICIDNESDRINSQNHDNISADIRLDDPVYCIYTSGSTGMPKGVLIPHRCLANLIDWDLKNRLRGLRMLLFSSISFDVSFHEIFHTLCSGGMLLLIHEDIRRNSLALLDCIVKNKVEKIYMPYVALQQLAESCEMGQMPYSLKEVMTAGEQLKITPDISRFFRLTGAVLHNHYGSSECQDVTTYTLTGQSETWPVFPPIGRPLQNIRIYILDQFLNPVPVGVSGDLYIGGDALPQGYLNRPDLTAERFIENPFGIGRLFKTGDLAKYCTDSNIECLGRADHQVKIRGFRIEPGEIETILNRHPSVCKSAVLPIESLPGQRQLVAYLEIRSKADTEKIESELRTCLKDHLPEHMIPSAFVMLEVFPLTPSGKTDRRALPMLKVQNPEKKVSEIPVSDTERRIVEIWQDVLNTDQIGIHDSFFEIGGNSLLLLRVQKQLIEEFGPGLRTVTLFQYPTIHSLAEHLSQSDSQSDDEDASLQRKPGRKDTRKQEIAIIGMSCRFPGAGDIGTFWRNLRDGVASVSFFSDEEMEIYDKNLLDHPDYVKAGAVLSDIDLFDAAFFGFTPREARMTDPQLRLLLECAWEAFENAGYNPESCGVPVGVYLGSAISTYLINNVFPAQKSGPFLETTFFKEKMSNDRNYYPTRISYKLNLTGPSINIQTACSTSLVAVHKACQSLAVGECDMALAGGISIPVPQKTGYLFEEGMIRSSDGHCRAFDANATGMMFGNGAGLVLLKPLADAISAGDHIYAVIKGSAVNNDGAFKMDYTAPSVEGQSSVISRALENAGVDAESISYVETHGTGTKLGDPVEIQALTRAFRQNTRKNHNTRKCAIGSVKTNIGHMDEAAGVAGLIKTIMALKHHQIPPSLNFEKPNPEIDFDNSPFHVNTSLREWDKEKKPRRAGVSSFGMGGTNCHVILEEAPEHEARIRKTARNIHLLPLSAKNPEALRELTLRYADHLKNHPDISLPNLCFTANTGRKHFEYRLALTADSVPEFQKKLAAFEPSVTKKKVTSPKIAFIFTGQGSQYVDMGRGLYEADSTFRKTLDHCDEILRPLMEMPLLEILYPSAFHNLLDETTYTQPALFALEYSLARQWQSWGISPDIVMGHSVGEYVAACLAGVFSLPDGLKLIAERARLLQSSMPGDMAVVAADERLVRDALASHDCQVSIAAVNTSHNTVISGEAKAVRVICERLNAKDIITTKLNVSHAFHSQLTAPILNEFEQTVRQVPLSEPLIPLVSNLTSKIAGNEITSSEYWRRHVRQPVRFADSIQTLAQQGANVIIEIGPKPVLIAMGRQCLPDHEGLWIPSLKPDHDDWRQLLSGLGELYTHGVIADLSTLDRNQSRCRVPLPTYPFQRQRFWINAREVDRQAVLQDESSDAYPLIGKQLNFANSQKIRFQSHINVDAPTWVKDHRVFQTLILLGAAYLEMALEAGKAISKSERIKLTDVILLQPLIVPDDGQQLTMQTVLFPEKRDVWTFEIFSQAFNENQWKLHTSGKLSVTSPETPDINLASLQAQCIEEVSVKELYQRFKNQGIHYGPSFRIVEQIWRSKDISLGKISVSNSETFTYQLNPLVLDACFQVLETTIPVDYKQKDFSPWLPFAVKEMHFYPSLTDHALWCYAEKVEDATWNIRLFSDTGRVITNIIGFKMRQAGEEKLSRKREWKDWLYETKWHQAERFGLSPNYSLLPRQMEKHLDQDVIMARADDKATPPQRSWLIFSDAVGTGKQLSSQFEARGDQPILIYPGQKYELLAPQAYTINPDLAEDYRQLIRMLPKLHAVVYLWSLDEEPMLKPSDVQGATERVCRRMLHLIHAILEHPTSPALWLITRGMQSIDGFSMSSLIQQAPLWGMGRTITLEYPEWPCMFVDLPSTWEGKDEIVQLFNEIWNPDGENMLALRGNQRYIARLERCHTQPAKTDIPLIQNKGSYLITGGLGGIGLRVAKWMVEKGAGCIVLAGRRGAVSDDAQSVIRDLKNTDTEIKVIKADVSKEKDVKEMLALCLKYAPLRGIIHAAGILEDAVLQRQTMEKFEKVMAPKAYGAWILHTLTQDMPLDFFVCFSSSTSLLGNAGQSNYAAANAFLDTLAHHRRDIGLPALSINWGAWAEVGAVTKLSHRDQERMRAKGENLIRPELGLQLLSELMGRHHPQMGVLPMDWQKFLNQFSELPPLFFSISKAVSNRQKPSADIHDQNLMILKDLPPGEKLKMLLTMITQEVKHVLGFNLHASIDPNQKFFDMGIDSLTAIELRNQIQKMIGHSLPVNIVFDHPTPADFTRYVAEEIMKFAQDEEIPEKYKYSDGYHKHSTLVRIQSNGSKPPIFMIPGILGSVFDFLILSNHLDEEQPVYALRSLGLDENVEPYTSIEDMASHNIKMIKTVQPQGPYFLVAHSFGCWIAFEMALQLHQQKRQVSDLILLDASKKVFEADNESLRFHKIFIDFFRIYSLGLGKQWEIPDEIFHPSDEEKAMNLLLKKMDSERNHLALSDIKRKFKVYSANCRADKTYIPHKSDSIRIKVLLAEELLSFDFLPDHKERIQIWQALSSKPVEIEKTPGNHFTMLHEPHVIPLANKIRAYLDQGLAVKK